MANNEIEEYCQRSSARLNATTASPGVTPGPRKGHNHGVLFEEQSNDSSLSPRLGMPEARTGNNAVGSK